MSAEHNTPKEGGPTIDSLLKGSNWDARLAEARAKREKVLAAKSGAPADQTAPEARTVPIIKSKVPPLRAIRPEQTPRQNPPAPFRLRLRWVFLGIGVAGCLAGGFMFWMR